jgi:hypothetical protein
VRAAACKPDRAGLMPAVALNIQRVVAQPRNRAATATSHRPASQGGQIACASSSSRVGRVALICCLLIAHTVVRLGSSEAGRHVQNGWGDRLLNNSASVVAGPRPLTELARRFA